MEKTPAGTVKLGGARGKIACNPALESLEAIRNGGQMVVHSDDVRGVTCPKCKEVPEYKAIMGKVKETMAV